MEHYEKFIYRQSGPNQLSGKKHVHPDEFELLYVTNGRGRVMIGARLFSLTPGTLYMINGEDVHSVTPDTGTGYVRTILNLPKEYLNRLLASAQEPELLPMLLQRGAVRLDSLAAERVEREFESVYNAKEHKNLLFAGALLALFSACTASASQVSPDFGGIISSVLSYIDQNITAKITLDDIEKHAFVSKYHIAHVFKDEIGMSIHQYISKKRLARCREALLGDVPVTKVYLLFGFHDYSSFYRAFKKEYGISPKDFKELHTVTSD